MQMILLSVKSNEEFGSNYLKKEFLKAFIYEAQDFDS